VTFSVLVRGYGGCEPVQWSAISGLLSLMERKYDRPPSISARPRAPARADPCPVLAIRPARVASLARRQRAAVTGGATVPRAGLPSAPPACVRVSEVSMVRPLARLR